jgi:hypothetical protein
VACVSPRRWRRRRGQGSSRGSSSSRMLEGVPWGGSSQASFKHRPCLWRRFGGAVKVSYALVRLLRFMRCPSLSVGNLRPSLKFGLYRCLCWFVMREKYYSFAEKYCWNSAEEQGQGFVIITVVADRSLLLYTWWMKSVTELIKKEYLLLILNTVTSLWCWWGAALYVRTTIWYDFVITSIVIVEINTFII